MKSSPAVAFLLIATISSCHSANIQFFSEANFVGQAVLININDQRCVDINGQFNKIISSVKTGGTCIEIFENFVCTGRSARLATGDANDLRANNFNDKIQSFKLCPGAQ